MNPTPRNATRTRIADDHQAGTAISSITGIVRAGKQILPDRGLTDGI
jgi:hypothetical protein